MPIMEFNYILNQIIYDTMYIKNKIKVNYTYTNNINKQFTNDRIDIFDNIDNSPAYVKGYRLRYINNEQFGINLRLYEK
jgi:hypothetical protein